MTHDLAEDPDALVRQYLRETASASDEDYRKMADFLKHFEAARPYSGLPPRPEKCGPVEAASIYSQTAENELVAISRRIAKDKITDQKLSHHRDLWPQVKKWCREEHLDQVSKIRLFFRLKRTGHPF
jgi:hypothetical protein